MRSRYGILKIKAQLGVSLIEVMIAVFIAAIGVLGAAAMQLNSLKYTDSAEVSSQASFIAYDLLDRIRANPEPASRLQDYAFNTADDVKGSLVGIQRSDLVNFKNLVQQLPLGRALVVLDLNGRTVTVTINWDESRAQGGTQQGLSDNVQTFTVSSDVK